MADPFFTLLGLNFRRWLGSRGFVMVAVAALFPMGLTGAWIGTHQADVAAESLTWAPANIEDGDNVTFTGVIANTGHVVAPDFNATLSVGSVTGSSLLPLGTNVTTISGLQPGERRQVALVWQARASAAINGALYALLDADTADVVGEVDEFNNQKPVPVPVLYKLPTAAQAPALPGNLTGAANATSVADVAVTDLALPSALVAQGEGRFVATVTNRGPDPLVNATVVVRVGSPSGTFFFPRKDLTQPLDLAPGATQTVELVWTGAAEGAYWAQAYVNVSAAQRDPTGGDNAMQKPLTIQSDATAGEPPAPPEKLTIKEFYIRVLSLLMIALVLPFIALFYAGGVIADEREAGTLPFLLTRPVPRWVLPLAKFLAGFAVAAIAVVVGFVAAFVLLFGQPGGDLGFLSTPLLASLLALFIYGAFFALMGTFIDRPYIAGLAFIIGWENLAPILVPWVSNLTIRQHLLNALGGWRLDQGLQWLPEGVDATNALILVALAGVAFVAGAALVAKRREWAL
jgi:ABC-2 type transport system permease protein